MRSVDRIVSKNIKEAREELEKALDADVLAYYGDIYSSYLNWYRQVLEEMVKTKKADKLVILLNTGGGEVEAVERLVEMQRHFYDEIIFVVPNLAMSAGTIFCMSGDRILMDYSSSLGPIDPQVRTKDGKWVPALGYLDKFEEILQKSRENELTQVELVIAQNQDLAELRRYEQARDLSVSLLQDWLIKYKFKNWAHHRTDPNKKGQQVTQEEKEARAKEIADRLGDNKVWHSHGRRIGIGTLTGALRLEIEDYSENVPLRQKINDYHDLITDYMGKQGWSIFINARNHEI